MNYEKAIYNCDDNMNNKLSNYGVNTMKIINLDQMKNMSIDNLIELYRHGYRLEEYTPVTSLSDFHTSNFSNVHTLQGSLLDPTTNFGKVIVSSCTGGCTETATEVTVDNGAKFPDPATRAFNLVWWNSTDYTDPSDDPNKEIVRCTAKSDNVLTITRAQEGTSASTKNSSGKVYKMILSPTAKMISDISSAITTSVGDHASLTTGIHGVAGNIVGISDTQILTNKTITDSTNNVTARSLKSATTVIDVSNATAPSTGQVLTATDSTTATWQTLATGGELPSGAILMWHGLISNIPSGFIICNGANGTPDLRSRFVRGAPVGVEAGGVGGSDTHTLTVAEMPSHNHSLVRGEGGGYGATKCQVCVDRSPGATGSTGGDGAHNNMPAYYQIIFIMKT